MLTDLAIQKLKATGTQYYLWDTQVPNLGIRVSQKGTKAFVYAHKGSRNKQTIGRYPAVGLKQAREAAVKLSHGTTAKTTSETLLEAYSAFLENHASQYAAKTKSEAYRLFHSHLKHLHKAQLSDISPRTLTAVTDALRNTPSEANHLFAIMRTFYQWAVQRQYLETSPLAHLKKPYREHARERVLTDDELAKLWRALSLTHGHFATILQLLILTGQRRTEIASLKWDQIRDGAIHFPKTKNGSPHLIPTTPHISEQLGYGDKKSEWLFPNRFDTDYFNGWCLKRNLDAYVKLDPWAIHDLRRTAATGMARLGTAPHIIERILNHSNPVSPIASVYQRYNHLEELRTALTSWGNHIHSLCA